MDTSRYCSYCHHQKEIHELSKRPVDIPVDGPLFVTPWRPSRPPRLPGQRHAWYSHFTSHMMGALAESLLAASSRRLRSSLSFSSYALMRSTVLAGRRSWPHAWQRSLVVMYSRATFEPQRSQPTRALLRLRTWWAATSSSLLALVRPICSSSDLRGAYVSMAWISSSGGPAAPPFPYDGAAGRESPPGGAWAWEDEVALDPYERLYGSVKPRHQLTEEFLRTAIGRYGRSEANVDGLGEEEILKAMEGVVRHINIAVKHRGYDEVAVSASDIAAAPQRDIACVETLLRAMAAHVAALYEAKGLAVSVRPRDVTSPGVSYVISTSILGR